MIQLCSPCMILLLKNIQSTSYSNYDNSYVQQWVAVQSKCNTGPLPTAVQPPATNITSLPGVVISNPLKALNGIFPDGTNLFAGQILYVLLSLRLQSLTIFYSCLPRTCMTYLVRPGDNCAAVAAANSITFAQLISYNLSINQGCTNLLSNTNICISPSGVKYTPTTIPGAMVMSMSYATAMVAPPGPTPFRTTPSCGKFYKVNPGDNCQQISLNNTITVDLFELINPSINADCMNLTPGLNYCVWPTSNWNTTSVIMTSTVPPPAPTLPGTISQCFAW